MHCNILQCNKCKLRDNQKPLLDNIFEGQVMWVGLSAKGTSCIESDIPLSSDTKSGQLVSEIEGYFTDTKFYKTNYVKCLPLNENGKLRYPTKQEMNICFSNLNYEIEEIKPRIVFLLGEKVKSGISKEYGVKFSKFNEYKYEPYVVDNNIFVPIHHPSYISVYKRRDINTYVESIKDLISEYI